MPWSSTDGWDYGSPTDPDSPFVCDVNYEACDGPPGPGEFYVSTGQPASLFAAVLPGTANLTVFKAPLGRTVTNFRGADLETISCTFQTIHNLTDTIIHDCYSGAGKTPTFMPSVVYDDSTLLRCDLVNTSYSAHLSYSSGTQNVRVSSNITVNSLVVNASAWFSGANPTGVSTLIHIPEPVHFKQQMVSALRVHPVSLTQMLCACCHTKG